MKSVKEKIFEGSNLVFRSVDKNANVDLADIILDDGMFLTDTIILIVSEIKCPR